MTVEYYNYQDEEYIRYLVETFESFDSAPSTEYQIYRDSTWITIDTFDMLLNDTGDGWYGNIIDNTSRVCEVRFIISGIYQTLPKSVTEFLNDPLVNPSEDFSWFQRVKNPYLRFPIKKKIGAVEKEINLDIPGQINLTSHGSPTEHSCTIDDVIFSYREYGSGSWIPAEGTLAVAYSVLGDDNLVTTFSATITSASFFSAMEIKAEVQWSNKTIPPTGSFERTTVVTLSNMIFDETNLPTTSFKYSNVAADIDGTNNIRFKINNPPDGNTNGTEQICLAFCPSNEDLIDYHTDFIDDGYIDIANFQPVTCSTPPANDEFLITKANFSSDVEFGASIPSIGYHIVFLIFGYKFEDELKDYYSNICPVFWDGSDFVGIESNNGLDTANVKCGYRPTGGAIWSDTLDFTGVPATWGSVSTKLRFSALVSGTWTSFATRELIERDSQNIEFRSSTDYENQLCVIEYESSPTIWTPIGAFIFDYKEPTKPYSSDPQYEWSYKLRTGVYSYDNNNAFNLRPFSVFDFMYNLEWTTDATVINGIGYVKPYTDFTMRSCYYSVSSGTDNNGILFHPYSWNNLFPTPEYNDHYIEGLYVEQTDSSPITIRNTFALYDLNPPISPTEYIFKGNLQDLVIPFVPIPEIDIYRRGDPFIYGKESYPTELDDITPTTIDSGIKNNLFLNLLVQTNGLLNDAQGIVRPAITPISTDKWGNVLAGSVRTAETAGGHSISLYNDVDDFIFVSANFTNFVELDYDGSSNRVMNSFIIGDSKLLQDKLSSYNVINSVDGISTARIRVPFGRLNISPLFKNVYGHVPSVGDPVTIYNSDSEAPSEAEFFVTLFYSDGETTIFCKDLTGNASNIVLKDGGTELASSDTGELVYNEQIPYKEVKEYTAILTDLSPAGELIYNKPVRTVSKYYIGLVDSDITNFNSYIDGHSVNFDLADELELFTSQTPIDILKDEIEVVRYVDQQSQFEVMESQIIYSEPLFNITADFGPDAFYDAPFFMGINIVNEWSLGVVYDGYDVIDFQDLTPPHVLSNIPSYIGVPIDGYSTYIPIAIKVSEDWNAKFVNAWVEMFKIAGGENKGQVLPTTQFDVSSEIANIYITSPVKLDYDDFYYDDGGDVLVDYILTRITVVIEGGGSQVFEIYTGVSSGPPPASNLPPIP